MARSYYTRDQVGDASVPSEHLADARVNYDVPGDDLPNYTAEGDEPQYVRSRWRAPQVYQPEPDGAASFEGDPTGTHASAGRPDRRRQYDALYPAGYSQPSENMRSSPEEMQNSRSAPSVAPATAPPRAFGGLNGTDPARAPELPLHMYNRPYGKWSADHDPAIVKIESLPPLAGTPYAQHEPTEHYEPNAGGDGITVNRNQAAGSSPNTYRPVPRPWDERLTISDPEAPPMSAPMNGRRWRL
ncbi:hypothetical protein [Streptomyces sp. ISL-100]|uniref:hypothetical protein n=1 Tax=Streptomyces sp. ISL-100 TaxID=2819173 RepID=UPI001BEA52D2|nr:hypothetical protein [Streptomyces sp. ISL-100]MBT2400640.1 hypothetical protein [Streptomyces sp. ISL-100]